MIEGDFYNMKKVREDLKNYISDKEGIANIYVMHCFTISMIVYFVCFILNVFDIFIVDKDVMKLGFIPSMVIYAIVYVVTKIKSVSSRNMKYFILFSIVVVFTLAGVTITYHVVVVALLPIMYSILYSSRKVMWYVYGLTVISTIIVVYGGYYYGLCDANMALLTTSKLDTYLSNGYFTLTSVNDNVIITLFLYFIIPRCLIYIAFMAVGSNIYKIITNSLQKASYAINDSYLKTVLALGEAVDAKDRYTSGHSKRVAEYSKMLAARMGKSEIEQEIIYRAGLLHDVGKIKIPVAIINKPGKLTDEEFDLIKIHPITGYHILKDISEYGDMALAAKYHHERYDGKGYPNGLKGESIPEVARILCVADSYDAMTSNRSYRKALPQDVVRSEIEKGKGTQFDPNVVEKMLQMIDEDTEYTLRQVDKSSCNILIIGDDEDSQQLMIDMMHDDSMYRFSYVDTKEEALKTLKEQQFELVILNIQKDRDKSWSILESIRESFQIPIVLMSDDKNLINTSEFIKYRCDDYITKPFGAMMIEEVIYNVTKK